MEKKIELVSYSRTEEVLNVLTHFLGLIIPFFIVIKIIPLCRGEAFPLICACLYALGSFMTFFSSCVYHILPQGDKKRVFRVIDHTAIFFAVAGTVTGCIPAVFTKGSPLAAVLMLILSWGSVITGTILTVFFFGKFKNVRMAMYILSSFICALLGSGTFKNLPKGALISLISGGIVLLIGCVLYKIGAKKKYIHSLFHVFIVAGLGIYCCGIYNYVFLLL